MKKLKIVVPAVLLASVIAVALFNGVSKPAIQAGSKAEVLAVATNAFGETFYIRDGKTNPVKPKTIFYERDEVFTKKGVVDLQIGQGAVLRLSQFSHMNLKNLAEMGSSSQIELHVKQGTLYSKLVKNLDKNSKFVVSTPTAVAGVRGTEFIMTDNSNSTEQGKKFEDSDIQDGIHVNEGAVSVKKRDDSESDEGLDADPPENEKKDGKKNSAEDLKQEIILKKGEAAVIKKGQDLKKGILEKYMEQKMAIFAKLTAMKEANYKLLKDQKDRNKAMMDKIREKQSELKDKMNK